MDLRKFKVTLTDGSFDIESDDMLVVEGFVMFILTDDDGNVDKTVAMFNNNFVKGVVEVTK